MPHRPLIAILAAAACLFLAACESKVTPENYDKITNGMTLSQVEKILGRGKDDTSHAGTSISSPGIQSASRSSDQVYLWDDGQGGTIQVIFADGKVVQKTKTGLD